MLQIAFLLAHPFVVALLAAVLVLGGMLVWRVQLRILFSSTWEIAGPKPESFALGNLPSIIKADPGQWHDAQGGKYGRTFRYTGFMGEPKLYSTDPRVFNHLMSNAYKYPKPDNVRKGLTRLLGNGLLVAEGETHKRQRRIISPALTALSIKPLVPIFLAKAHELTDVLLGGPTDVKEVQNDLQKQDGLTNVVFWLARATLDVIGSAGFDYDFSSLRTQENELSDAFKTMFEQTTQPSLLVIAQTFLPWLDLIPTKRAATEKRCMDVMTTVGTGIIQAKKQLLQKVDGEEKGVTKSDVEGRDVISMLIRANMASDVPVSQKLSDAEVLAQVTTFMLAGYETSSTALTWTLHLLSENPAVQDKLREELQAVADDEPSMETLNGLEYLDAVVRESLRVCAPVAGTVRVADVDDIIPLSVPIVNRRGQEINEIKVAEGTSVFLGLLNLNRTEEIWGANAREFMPERWLKDLPESASKGLDVPYAHISTFLAGPRGCIGWRFALLEIKAFLFVLLRSIKFEKPVPSFEYIHRSSLVQRPLIKGREVEGYQMRLKLSPVKSA